MTWSLASSLLGHASRAMTNELIRVGGKAVDGMLFGHFVIMNPLPASLEPIALMYRKRYGAEPSYDAFYGFDVVLMLEQALAVQDRPTQLDGDSMKRVILRHGQYRSPLGDYTLDAYGDSLRPAHLSRVHSGVFELIR